MAKEKIAKIGREQLEQENIALRAKVASLEESQKSSKEYLGDSLSEEIRKIRIKGKSTIDTILVTEKNDHTNVSLWTKDGKRIGPMHPDNAIKALERFSLEGIRLTVDQPTAEQIDAYHKTPEYALIQKKFQESRARKDKSRRAGQMEKLAAEIAKMSGTTVEAINHILKAHEVGKAH